VGAPPAASEERRPRAPGGETLKVRRQPRQLRSQITVTAILDATVRVLLDRGYPGTTTNLVAEVAGVGIGSLYEYFPNKEALVAALVGREVDRFVTALEREMSTTLDRPFPEALRGALAAALDELEARRDLVRVLVVEYPYVGRLSVIGRLPRRIAELAAYCLRRWGDQLSFGDHPANYYVLANMLGGVYLSQTLAPVAPVPRAEMLDALSAMLLRILEPRARPRETPESRTNLAQTSDDRTTLGRVQLIGARSG
jgi:AcrR family transcriptional regulator